MPLAKGQARVTTELSLHIGEKEVLRDAGCTFRDMKVIRICFLWMENIKPVSKSVFDQKKGDVT